MQPDPETPRGLTPQSNLRTIHLEDPRIASRGAAPGCNAGTRQKAQLHQAARILTRQVDPIQDRRVAPAEIDQCCGEDFRLAVVATQLHLDFSMRLSEIFVKSGRFFRAFFGSQRCPVAPKCAKIKDNRMTNGFAVRAVRLSDLDRILEIERTCFGTDAYDRNLFADLFHKCGDLFLAASVKRNICGYVLTCVRGRESPGSAELVSLAVEPAARRKGAASALLESTVRRLRRRAVSRFSLMVRVTNEPAMKFYERYGFTKIRIVRRYYEDGGDGFLMAKTL